MIEAIACGAVFLAVGGAAWLALRAIDARKSRRPQPPGTIAATAGATIAAGQAVYIGSDGKVRPATPTARCIQGIVADMEARYPELRFDPNPSRS